MEKGLRKEADEALTKIKSVNEPNTSDLNTYRDCVLFSFTILKG
jgi:hypothetical protein